MGKLLVFVHFDGQWIDDSTYKNFKSTGIQIPNDCTYDKLIAIISERLKFEKEENEIHISYQVKEEYPNLQIEDDSTLQFYIQLKSEESNCTKYPLCITLQIKEKASNSFQTQETTPATSQNQSTEIRTTDTSSNIYEYAKQLGKSIIEERT